MTDTTDPTRRALPLILIRGFGGVGVEDEKRIAYQGFNDGTVYPQKRGENYIYEGLILRFMKSDWQYQDATNVVGYYSNVVRGTHLKLPAEVKDLDPSHFSGDRVVIDPVMAGNLIRSAGDPCKTLWVFRYYDLDDRQFASYGKALVRLIGFIRDLAVLKSKGTTPPPKVNILAHSMGGLLVREAVQVTYPRMKRQASDYINKIVTLGTPHQGISFQFLRDWIKLDAEQELEHFNPKFQADKDRDQRTEQSRGQRNEAAYLYFHEHFPLQRLLTVVGTNYRTYGVTASSWLNRLFSVAGEGGATYNRSDGLVKQTFAQIPGAPRTFIHKCHGGPDSLVTSREAYEIATRFFFGDVVARLTLKKAEVIRGGDFFGESEFFFGISIKPRQVDFELFHQSAEAENCYGPFSTRDLTDPKVSFDWADRATRLIWEGCLDTSKLVEDPERNYIKDMVLRMDCYVGERDTHGLGFSDNVIFRKQYYLRAILSGGLRLYCHTDERFMAPAYVLDEGDRMRDTPDGWEFDVAGTGFKGTFGVRLDHIPLDGHPVPLREFLASPAAALEPETSGMPHPQGETGTPGA
jgi:triacylglycerol esterase/lipase EstA (alpha/beta hydrolase family)